VRGSIAPRRLELELDLAGGVDLHPLLGKRTHMADRLKAGRSALKSAWK